MATGFLQVSVQVFSLINEKNNATVVRFPLSDGEILHLWKIKHLALRTC